MNNKDKEILHIALPAIVTNITVPLLGLIDVAITGHLGQTAYIGAIAVGSMLFNVVYWLFGFLRMGSSGMTAQAYGRADADEAARLKNLIDSRLNQTVTIRELAEGGCKLSVRTSGGLNATKVCARLGGGGHAAAAGCTVSGTLAEAEAAILDAIRQVEAVA